jgi:hypothetical protein
MLGEEDHKGDCWKRCPLCFVTISVKDLYTLHITNVKQYQVGDNIEFSFLTRKKDSFTLSYKNKQETDNSSCSQLNVYDPFSKFTLTSDVDLSVRHAISDLDGWLARADSGLVDDLEKLPYVSDAMQQLKQRKSIGMSTRLVTVKNLLTPLIMHTRYHQYLQMLWILMTKAVLMDQELPLLISLIKVRL